MEFTVGVVHFVPDVVRATGFLETELRFTATFVSDREAVVENGALSIRLREAEESHRADCLELEVTTRSLGRACELLESVEGVVRIQPDRHHGASRVERVLECPHGIRIRMVREYDEDELGVIPPLPTSLSWDPGTTELVGALLRSVPLAFRDAARSRITQTAEVLAVENGSVAVATETALRAMVQATPPFQHAALGEAMTDAGLDPEAIFATAGVAVPKE